MIEIIGYIGYGFIGLVILGLMTFMLFGWLAEAWNFIHPPQGKAYRLSASQRRRSG